jgi:hypothetical protein
VQVLVLGLQHGKAGQVFAQVVPGFHRQVSQFLQGQSGGGNTETQPLKGVEAQVGDEAEDGKGGEKGELGQRRRAPFEKRRRAGPEAQGPV